MTDEPAAKRAKTGGSAEGQGSETAEVVNPWRHNCADVISFHLLESVTEPELIQEMARGGKVADGEFFHQHFGEEEQINGYRGLKVKVWVSVRTYHVWVEITHTARKTTADSITKVFNEHFPSGVARSSQEFISSIVTTADKLKDIASQGSTLQTLDTAAHGKVLIQYHNLVKAPQEIQDLHARFEPLMLFYIDGASLIEKDENWDVFLALQQREDGSPALLGATTLYNFWAYPDTKRIRLAQILVMPPYRDAGLGKAMLALAYQLAKERQCVDLTLEDPSPNLQRVREKLEVEMLQSSPWVMKQVQSCVEAVTGGKQEWPQEPTPPLPVRRPVAMSDAGSVQFNATAGTADNSASVALPSAAAANEQGPGQQATGMDTTTSSPTTNTNNRAGSGASATRKTAPTPEGPVACITPSHSFLAAITHEFKIYSKEARLVWEALLFLAPGLWSHETGKAVLTQLVRSRLEAGMFASVKAQAEKKDVVPVLPEPGQTVRGEDFIMMRVKTALEEEAGAAAGPSSGTVAAGRLTLTTMSVEEKEEKLSELCDERWEQLRTLQSLLNRMKA